MPVLAPDLASSDRSPARVTRAFRWSGIAPLGAFLVLHLAMNAQALVGARAFARTVDALHRVPGLPLLEELFVFAPLLFHGSLGVWLVATRRSLGPSPYAPAWTAAMRVTGLVALAFLAMHLPELRFHDRGARLGGGELGTVLDADLSTMTHGVPWRGVVYLIGTGAVTFHFLCGLWGAFARTRAGSVGRRRVLAAWCAGVVAALMWGTFADVVVWRATGARILGGAERDEPLPADCR